MSKRVSYVCGLLALSTLMGAAGAQNKGAKAPAKPKTPLPAPAKGVKGTTQLAGDNGKIGTTYTIGKDSPVNFTLTGVEYSVQPTLIGDATFAPKADEKLMVLTYTVQNPNNADTTYDWSTLKFTVVDANNVNREYVQAVGRPDTKDKLGLDLKPAQKIAAYTAILVPAKGHVQKLIVESDKGGDVLRYHFNDQANAIKGLEAPFADPAEKGGVTARAEISGETGKFYPMLNFAVKYVSSTYSAGPLGEFEAEDGKRFYVATITLKNISAGPDTYDRSMIAPILITSDDEKAEYAEIMLKSGRNEAANAELKPGEEATVRILFQVAKDLTAKSLHLLQSESRTYIFDVKDAK